MGDDYNEDLMAGLAEASDANYYYVKDTEKLPEIFAKELGELLTVAVRDVRIEIICPDGVKPLGFIGRPEKFENQRAVVNLSQFTPGQDRYLVFALPREWRPAGCRQRERELHRRTRTAAACKPPAARPGLISPTTRQLSDKSVNGAVFAQKELMLTAVAKDEAMAQADAGNYSAAAKILTAQNAALSSAYGSAPAGVQVQIRAETNNLNDFSGRLGGGAYSGSLRKAMQEQSFNTRNSK